MLIEVLIHGGFDCATALETISNDSIKEIENFVNEDRSGFQNILNGTIYEKKAQFLLVPGHRVIISKFPKWINQLKSTQSIEEEDWILSDFSFISLIENAQNNMNKDPRAYRYTEIVKYSRRWKGLLRNAMC